MLSPIFTKGARYYGLLFPFLLLALTGNSQSSQTGLIRNQPTSRNQPDPLTVEKIMQDPKWIGTSPSAPYWSRDGKYLFFNWNPDRALSDSAYYITPENRHPQKAPFSLQHNLIAAEAASYN